MNLNQAIAFMDDLRSTGDDSFDVAWSVIRMALTEAQAQSPTTNGDSMSHLTELAAVGRKNKGVDEIKHCNSKARQFEQSIALLERALIAGGSCRTWMEDTARFVKSVRTMR